MCEDVTTQNESCNSEQPEFFGWYTDEVDSFRYGRAQQNKTLKISFQNAEKTFCVVRAQ